jgi:hypothetical protein
MHFYIAFTLHLQCIYKGFYKGLVNFLCKYKPPLCIVVNGLLHHRCRGARAPVATLYFIYHMPCTTVCARPPDRSRRRLEPILACVLLEPLFPVAAPHRGEGDWTQSTPQVNPTVIASWARGRRDYGASRSRGRGASGVSTIRC